MTSAVSLDQLSSTSRPLPTACPTPSGRRPEIDWRGIRAVRNFIAHDYDGTDEEVLWQAIAVQFPAIIAALGLH